MVPAPVPAIPNSRRKRPSGAKTWTTCELWSATKTEPSGPTDTACGKRSTPSPRWPIWLAALYAQAGAAPGQAGAAGGGGGGGGARPRGGGGRGGGGGGGGGGRGGGRPPPGQGGGEGAYAGI